MSLDPNKWNGNDASTWPILGDIYNKFYAEPAEKQSQALKDAQEQSLLEAERNRQFQTGGFDRALTFYGPARNVLAEMMGGQPQGGFGQMKTPSNYGINLPTASETIATQKAAEAKAAADKAAANNQPILNDAVGPTQGTEVRDDGADFLPGAGTFNRVQRFADKPSLSNAGEVLGTSLPGSNAVVDAGKYLVNKFW